jgi:uncharacterized membrane protein
MNKDEFLAQLRQSLRGMPDADKNDILHDYEEHFRMGIAEGRNEEEIAQQLGNPRVIGNSYRIDAMLDDPKHSGSPRAASVLRAVFASISLTFLNLVFVVGPFFGLVGILIGLWAVSVSLMFAGVRLSVSFLWPVFEQIISNRLLDGAFMFFGGIGLAAVGLLAAVGMVKLTQWFVIGVASYVRFNARIVRGER